MPWISTDGPENELAMVATKNEITCIFTGLTSFFAIKTLPRHLWFMDRRMDASGLFYLWWSQRTGQLGSRPRFFRFRQYRRGEHRARTQATADGSRSTGEKGMVLHFCGGEKQVSEGVVVGMVSGSADAHGWTSVGRYFLLSLVKGNNSPHEVSWCLFHIFCDPQPEIPNFWNKAALSNVPPVQLYSGILDCSDEGSRYQWNKWGKVAIGPIAILAIGEVQDGSAK